MLNSHRKDGLVEWMKDMLNHSFVLDATETYVGTMSYFEELVEEHRKNRFDSRIRGFVPTIGVFHTPLPLAAAFQTYDEKYSISKRKFVPPTFNEIRHILNLAQIMAIGSKLELISFDGDQTLYQDGGNFEASNLELASGIITLLCNNVKVAVITAAGYGLDGSKYELRLRGLLDRFVSEGLTKAQIECFHVVGGECNYLLQSTVVADADGAAGGFKVRLVPVPVELWQAEHLNGPRPGFWPQEHITQMLDVAEKSMRDTVSELNLRAKILRKERAVGVYPGGKAMIAAVPKGHGSNKIKREALDELVLRLMECLRRHDPPISLPYCVFNGGSDAWLDVGNKSVGMAALQAYFKLDPANCLHVGDQVRHAV